VFLPDAAAIGEAKQEICRRHGLEGLFPGDVPESDVLVEGGRLLFRRLVEMMDRSDVIIANMTPFRGVSIDPGTAVEIGYMYAKGRPVFGYTNERDIYAARMARLTSDGTLVEPFGLTDNLMCVAPALESGALVVRDDVPESERFQDLRGFEDCVRQAVARLV
jgi:nucleoside 2-deoxyribosyltransferase